MFSDYDEYLDITEIIYNKHLDFLLVYLINNYCINITYY